MDDNEVMCIIIEYMISQVKSKDCIEKFNTILKGIEGKKHIEETKSPRFQSILIFGTNIFPFSIGEYRAMAQLIKG